LRVKFEEHGVKYSDVRNPSRAAQLIANQTSPSVEAMHGKRSYHHAWPVGGMERNLSGLGALFGGISGFLCFGQPVAHVISLSSHRAVLQDGQRQKTTSEPRHWIDKALDKKLPQWVGTLLIVSGGWLAWVASGWADDGSRSGFAWTICGGLLFSVGLALFGIR
jgi:hypothetical protein